MLQNALAERNRTEQDGEGQANFVNGRMQQRTARRSQKRHKDRGAEAMRKAEARQANGQSIKPSITQNRVQHIRLPLNTFLFATNSGKLQHNIEAFLQALAPDRAAAYMSAIMHGTLPYSPVTARPAAIANWLLAVAFLVFAMVVVGGITRLTESGLSITEWKPITGALPPLSDAAWADAFAKYQKIPEYAQINKGMSLSDFKFIFFWEWTHRLIGRLIGLAFAAPLLWFAVRKAIPEGYGLRLTALLALGGLQGAIGWWMVASGLSVRTDVSHYRLATHLLTALFILSGLIWTALDLQMLARNPAARPARLTRVGAVVGVILAVQLLFGAYTAGLNAGHVANTWPLMNDHFYPEGVTWLGSLWTTATNDPFLVHFIHRWWAWVAVGALILLARRAKASGGRPASIAIHSAFGTQILLGIATVVSNVALPFAVLHQAAGALLVISTAWGAHAIGRNKEAAT
jgi:heme a synthase